MSDAEQLGKIRDRIDAIDEQVHQLLNQRAEAAMEVARIKLSADPNAVFYR
ncbi:MAG: chorismate mutase, partial [Sedimenticolaceae bacterium]